jgi:hypothetical protein
MADACFLSPGALWQVLTGKGFNADAHEFGHSLLLAQRLRTKAGPAWPW